MNTNEVEMDTSIDGSIAFGREQMELIAQNEIERRIKQKMDERKSRIEPNTPLYQENLHTYERKKEDIVGDRPKNASRHSVSMNTNARNYIIENLKQFYAGAVNQYNVGRYVETGYTISCEQDINLQGVTRQQMLDFSRNDQAIRHIKQGFEKAGIHFFIKEKAGRLIILACSDKNRLDRMVRQYSL